MAGCPKNVCVCVCVWSTCVFTLYSSGQQVRFSHADVIQPQTKTLNWEHLEPVFCLQLWETHFTFCVLRLTLTKACSLKGSAAAAELKK